MHCHPCHFVWVIRIIRYHDLTQDQDPGNHSYGSMTYRGSENCSISWLRSSLGLDHVNFGLPLHVEEVEYK
jgi:hypothetical protein